MPKVAAHLPGAQGALLSLINQPGRQLEPPQVNLVHPTNTFCEKTFEPFHKTGGPVTLATILFFLIFFV